MQALQIRFRSLVLQDVLTELAHSLAADFSEGLLVVSFKNQPAYIILIGVNQWVGNDLREGQICQGLFSGNALFLRCCGDSRKLVTRFLFVSMSKQFPQIRHG